MNKPIKTGEMAKIEGLGMHLVKYVQYLHKENNTAQPQKWC
jgi:hypothetical protein